MNGGKFDQAAFAVPYLGEQVDTIVANQYGRRLLNVEAMQTLDIKPKRQALLGTELVKTLK